MNIISLSVIGVFSVIFALAIKQYNKEVSAILVIATVVILALQLLPNIISVCSGLDELTAIANFSENYLPILLKALGICYITQISSAVCKENGSGAIASQIELGGKICILILAIPLYVDVIEMISDFLK